MLISEAIEQFLRTLATEKRLSPHTCSNYLRDLDKLQHYAEKEKISHVEELQEHHLRLWLGDLRRQALATKTLQRWLSAVKSFCRHCVKRKLIHQDPSEHLQAPKGSKSLPKTLDVDQVGKLFEDNNKDFMTMRDRVIVEVFYSSGLRLAELTGLNLGDIDLREGSLRVTGKGNKTRLLPIGRHAVDRYETGFRNGDFMPQKKKRQFLFPSVAVD